jgi:hypothetical protein
VKVSVDEAGHDRFAGNVEFPPSAVVAHDADDTVAANRHVALEEIAGGQVEDPPAFQDDIGLAKAATLLDGARKKSLALVQRFVSSSRPERAAMSLARNDRADE